jgi:hypothetical protein
LLSNPDVVWIVGKDNDTVVAGATAVRADGLNGLNNVFCRNQAHLETMIRAAVMVFPDLPACGYEMVVSIPPYLSQGFQTAGKLIVWLRPEKG